MRFGFRVANFLGLVIAVVSQQPADLVIASSPTIAMTSCNESAAKYVGTDACAKCHKDGHRRPAYAVAGKEYAIWANKDPHSIAYENLFNKRSKLIAKNLKLEIEPHKSKLCLKCHATNVPNRELAASSKHTVTDGVGCESCHGPAEKWLVQHSRSDWKYWTPTQKNEIGFLDTDNLASRSRKCVECHVGSEGRDVNHDLIAAGHPRLYFEMSAYQSKMPRHWSRTKDLNQNSAALESRLWLVGQFVTAAASLDVLHRRVETSKAPWPEFSEYSCISCHHDLSQKRWDNDGVFKIGLSKPVWGSWHFSLLDKLSNTSGKFGSGDFTIDIGKLRDGMQKPIPERDAISSTTFEMREYCSQMADLLSQVPLSEHDVFEISGRLVASDSDREVMDWDTLTQRYLAAVALHQSLIDMRPADDRIRAPNVQQSRIRLLEIRDTLRFIENYDGPKDLDISQKRRIDQNFAEIFHLLRNY